MECMVCEYQVVGKKMEDLAKHLLEEADQSNPRHIAWLNKNLTKEKHDLTDLSKLLNDFFILKGTKVSIWLIDRFIKKFFGTPAHPFVEALQHPSRAILLGYVFEHQHFLRQWVRSCSFIIARTTEVDVTQYELDNIHTEFGGNPSHYELLLQMGESLGVSRTKILTTPPLPATKFALEAWQRIAETHHWVETMAAMHSLELIAHRDLRKDGASKHYFNPDILESDRITKQTKAFLLEGYEADIHHAEEAFQCIDKYALELDLLLDVQITFIKSIELFDSYLMSRLQRAKDFE